MTLVVLLPAAVVHARLRGHEYSRAGAVDAGPPGARGALHGAGGVERRGLLAEVPDGAGLVLGVPVGRALREPSAVIDAVVDDGRPDAEDRLRPARHPEHVGRGRA